MRVTVVTTGMSNSGYAVRVTPACARRLDLLQRKSVTVQFGQRAVVARVSIRRAKGQADVLGMSPDLARALSLPRSIRLRAVRQNGRLRIGPLIGILMPGSRGLPEPFGNMTASAAYFVEMGRRAATLPVAFTVSGIDFERRLVRGYTLSMSAQPRWVRRTVPLPDVVFDQVTLRVRDGSRPMQTLRRQLDAAGIPYFNHGYFDKWEVHQWLSACPDLAPHLPETQRLGAESLEKAAAAHHRLFIKPSRGSLGRNIAVLTKLNGKWELRAAARRAKRQTIEDLAGVPRQLPKVGGGGYIVQQGLDLCRARGRPVDIRALMQRDGRGAWRMTKVFARIPPSGQLVANITRGGKGVPIARALVHCFSRSRVAAIVEDVRRLARRVCACLEQMVPGHLGEVGVDLGVDSKGHVWIIEVNSKPHRKAYEDLSEKAGARSSFQRPMLYAAYLAGFGEEKRGVEK